MATRRSPTSAEIGRIAADAEQQALMVMEVEETSLQSTYTLPTGKKEERRDYVAWEVLGVDEKDLMFGGTLEGYDNFLSFKDLRDLLFARESESVVEKVRSYMKGKHIDAENWSLRYPDPCPQQGLGDDCVIFT
ncbi:hypothetical protein Taro_055320 [Colocasia esculenta]|uniref:Uncharacterized protein n=1 Tax=Colocasia esculenta TaxID=4460 RepID=A0A843XT99_COLES|nr:hypothetical protein [Colocasia esculenta]